MTERYTKLVTETKTRPTYLVYGEEKDTPTWYFVAVEGTKERKFLTLLKQKESFDICDFGTILLSGFGDEPGPQHYSRLKLAGLI